MRIDPDEYPRRLQEVKAYLALHNVYGVDLNATAVELAEISLWLDTMVSGLSAPWFGLHLRRGNSLIGARRAVYRRSQVADKSWLGAVPRDLPLTSLPDDIAADRIGSDLGDGIHHFLLPADGWGAAADAKEAAGLVPDAVKQLKRWRGATKAKPSKTQVDALAELANRVETLWQISYRRLHLAEQEIRRSIPVWGAGELPAGGAVQREQIEESLADEAGAYRRLRRVMDAWTALWFWPLTEAVTTVDGRRVEPPTVDQWIAGLQALLGRNPDVRQDREEATREPGPGQIPSPRRPAGTSWAAPRRWSWTSPAPARSMRCSPTTRGWWCASGSRSSRGSSTGTSTSRRCSLGAGSTCRSETRRGCGPIVDVDALLAEGDPWWKLAAKPSQTLTAEKRAEIPWASQYLATLVVDGHHGCCVSKRSCLGRRRSTRIYGGLRPDLYRCFMEQRVAPSSSERGISGLIHPDTHFTDEQGRAASWRRPIAGFGGTGSSSTNSQLFEIDHQ